MTKSHLLLDYSGGLPGAKFVVPKNLMVPTLWPTTSTLSPRRSSPSRRILLAADGAEEFKPVKVVGGVYGDGRGRGKKQRKNSKNTLDLFVSFFKHSTYSSLSG